MFQDLTSCCHHICRLQSIMLHAMCSIEEVHSCRLSRGAPYHCQGVVHVGADAKICDLDTTVEVHQHVRRFDVPVYLRGRSKQSGAAVPKISPIAFCRCCGIQAEKCAPEGSRSAWQLWMQAGNGRALTVCL